ncbi:MAG: hypothetical protein ACKOAU_12330 [Pirellula sp.]
MFGVLPTLEKVLRDPPPAVLLDDGSLVAADVLAGVREAGAPNPGFMRLVEGISS